MNCTCPLGAALTTIDTVTCPESFGQIQKVAFVRLKDGNGAANKFTSTKQITKLASWAAFLAATDGTKIVVSPYVQAPTTDGGDAITFGGGNETPGGVEEVTGRNPIAFSGVFRSIPQSVIAAMKQLQCEAKVGNLGIYLFDGNNNIAAIKGATEGDFLPIPVRALFIGDKIFGGFEAPDSNSISWQFEPNYSDKLSIVAAEDFSPVSDLQIQSA